MTVISFYQVKRRLDLKQSLKYGEKSKPLRELALLCFCPSISSGYLSYPAIATQYPSLDAYPMHNSSPVHDLKAIPQQR